MAKKVRDDEFDDEFENDNEEIENVEEQDDSDDSDDDSDDDSEGGVSIINDDEDKIDIVIEIDEDDLDLTDDDVKEEPSEEDEIVLSKHKMEGKHSLKYDSIFKGKKEDPLDESDPDGPSGVTGLESAAASSEPVAVASACCLIRLRCVPSRIAVILAAIPASLTAL
jgi:hypothetical protein